MRLIGSRSARRFAAAAVVAALGAATAGCQTTQSTPTAAALPIMAASDRSDADWRRDVTVYGQQYRANPGNVDAALHYAQALRATGQRAQAVAVLQQISIQNPKNKTVLGEYGRGGFVAEWLRHRGLAWAADIIPDFSVEKSKS